MSDLTKLKSNNKLTPVPQMIVRGVIVSNEEASSENWNRQAIRSAFIENDLQELYDHSEWGVGGISFNSVVPVRGKSNRYDGVGKYAAAKKGIQFAKAINRVIQTPEVKEQQLSGYFDVLIDSGREPIVFSVDIEDGKVSYQQAELVCPEPIVLPR
jgi:hypothetical protein